MQTIAHYYQLTMPDGDVICGSQDLAFIEKFRSQKIASIQIGIELAKSHWRFAKTYGAGEARRNLPKIMKWKAWQNEIKNAIIIDTRAVQQ